MRVVPILIASFVVMAIIFQNNQYDHPFKVHDGPYKNIKACLEAPEKHIKWRTLYITSILCTFLLFSLCHNRLPTDSELITYLIIIFSSFTLLWYYIDYTLHAEARKYGMENLKRLRRTASPLVQKIENY